VLVNMFTTVGMAFCAAILKPIAGDLASLASGVFSYRVTTPLRAAFGSNSGLRV